MSREHDGLRERIEEIAQEVVSAWDRLIEDITTVEIYYNASIASQVSSELGIPLLSINVHAALPPVVVIYDFEMDPVLVRFHDLYIDSVTWVPGYMAVGYWIDVTEAETDGSRFIIVEAVPRDNTRVYVRIGRDGAWQLVVEELRGRELRPTFIMTPTTSRESPFPLDDLVETMLEFVRGIDYVSAMNLLSQVMVPQMKKLLSLGRLLP